MPAPDGGPGGSSPAAMLADAIGRTAVLEHRMTLVSSDLSEIGAGQEDLKKMTSGIGRQLEALQLAVAMLGAEPAEVDDETALVDWSTLDCEEAETEWERLYTWLDQQLVPTYRLTVTQLHACWTSHAAVREELAWLKACWFQTYRRPGSPGSSAGEWHTRWLPGALERIAAHLHRAGCTLGSHEGEQLPEEARPAAGSVLSTRALWLDDGRVADIAERPPPEE